MGVALGAAAQSGGIGAGLGDGLEGSRLRMFVDIAKGHRQMQALDGSGAAPVDENGWPKTDASTVLFDIRPVPAWAPPVDDPDGFTPDWSGTYRVSLTGQADLSVGGDPLVQIANVRYEAETNTTRAELTVKPGGALCVLTLKNTKRSAEAAEHSGFTGLKVIRPGYAEGATQLFTNEFLAAVAPFQVLRFMGFLASNSTNPLYTAAKNKVEWADRRLPTDATQQSTPQRAAGVAWEYAIAICNATGKDLWLNVPIAATDDYVLQLARLMRGRLRADVRVYLEVSNEVWNPGFTQYAYNKAAALDEVTNKAEPYLNNPAVTDTAQQAETWARRRVLRRLHDVVQIFASVYGQAAVNERLRAVYAWWTIYPSQYQGILAWSQLHFGEPKSWLWAVAKTNYYNDSARRAGQSPEEIVAVMKTDSDKGRTYTTALRTVADTYGLHLVTYEAGPDNGGGATDNIGNRIRANRLASMGSLVEYDYRTNWRDLGGELYMFLDVATAYSRYGCWGQTEDAGVLDTAKMKAVWGLTGYVPGGRKVVRPGARH